jgi:hypothetical protein
LLHRAEFPARDGGIFEVIRTLDPSHDLYLRDHQLDGKPVLPLAMAMELMAELAQHGWPELEVVGLRDLQVFKGVVLEDGPKAIRLVARASTDAIHERLVTRVNVEITDSEGTGRPHYRATVELADTLPQPPTYQPPFADSLRPFPMTVKEAYRQWLFQGPLFQGLTQVEGIADQGMTAILASSSPNQCLRSVPEGQWLIDPVVFDSGLQLGILWTRAHLDMTPLPSRFRSYRRFGSLSGSEVRCHLHVAARPMDQVIHFNIAFVGADGRLVGLLEDIETSCSKALNRLAGGRVRD